MKFLEYTPLDSINYFLSHINLGECTLKGNLEAYSCKHAGSDKKMSFSLEHEILDYLGQSSDSDSQSPTDLLSCRSSRKTLIYLVLTLGHIYPDYDFSAVHAHRFFREEEWDGFVQIFNTYMFEATKEWATANEGGSLLESTTKAIDEVVKLAECEVYSYNPDPEGDPLLEKGAIWSFNFFFYNRKLKRVVSFRCCCLSNLAAEGLFLEEMSNDDEDEGGMFDDMDM
ncbi:Maf1 regulator [Cinnamomum micranthum f. kanehirae]|uniref:Repressor of RNA polymerase III transcription n=1 Tax=Cinnamomum micranthum f. kanehirae TaxID=337451 RepID=A0A3S3PHF0_9MAGN|nr:Maf1 regulator [Cinnamomum micranthum f. kanehirae]